MMSASFSSIDIGVPFKPRGPLSSAVLNKLTCSAEKTELTVSTDLPKLADRIVLESTDVLRDDDIQLALFVLYASSYGSFDQLTADLEWDLELLETRQILETAFEHDLRNIVPMPELPEANSDSVARFLFEFTAADAGPSLSRYFAKEATFEQAQEFLMQRSIYTLREADPHSWAIPRLVGRPKVALVEIQADEYGGGNPDRMHATIFAATLRGADLKDTYGAYLDDVPAVTLTSHNMMSMFGMNRRLIGAIVGHLAAFEMTSSIPNRMYGDGFRRLGFEENVTDYFDEHVEADAVHEQIAAHDLAGRLAEDQPELLADIVFGASACLIVDGWVGDHMLTAWKNDQTSLRTGANQ